MVIKNFEFEKTSKLSSQHSNTPGSGERRRVGEPTIITSIPQVSMGLSIYLVKFNREFISHKLPLDQIATASRKWAFLIPGQVRVLCNATDHLAEPAELRHE